ncbi:MAG TPA: hypothetical protein VN729_05985 [Ktedonobacteraceae bacterium]|nr:hypothetical protein [Ktedonobacteraceae bacterium]
MQSALYASLANAEQIYREQSVANPNVEQQEESQARYRGKLRVVGAMLLAI